MWWVACGGYVVAGEIGPGGLSVPPVRKQPYNQGPGTVLIIISTGTGQVQVGN